MLPNIRGPIRHGIVPGDISDGRERPYKAEHLIIERPSLPILKHFYNALPASFVPLLVRGMGGAPDAPGGKYKGLVPSDSGFFPMIQKRKPWER